MRHLKLKDIIRHYEAVQVIGIVIILVGARVPIHAGLHLDEWVTTGGLPVARHGWWERREIVFVIFFDLRRSVERSSTWRLVVLLIGGVDDSASGSASTSQVRSTWSCVIIKQLQVRNSDLLL